MEPTRVHFALYRYRCCRSILLKNFPIVTAEKSYRFRKP